MTLLLLACQAPDAPLVVTEPTMTATDMSHETPRPSIEQPAFPLHSR